MSKTITRRSAVQGLSDSAVVAAGAAAITLPWWEQAVQWMPTVVQGVIAAATLVFVIARAVNEVRKFFTQEKD